MLFIPLHSTFEIVFSHRPQFPLSGVLDPDLNPISPDVQQYVKICSKQIQTVRAQVHENVRQSQLKMVSRYSSGVQPLNLQSGDYVFQSTEPTGHGQKLQHKFEGPYVVHRLSSPHMVIIKDPNTNMCLKDAVHIDRLKMTFVREPAPSPYFMDSVQTQIQTETIPVDMEMHHQQMGTQSRGVPSTSSSTEPILPQPVSDRPKRTIRKPVRYRNSTCVSEDIVSSSDWSSRYKIKRIVGQKQIDNDIQ